MGREAFLKRVWEWKAELGGTIVNQLKRLGASCDWSRERFTMDEGLSKAVLKVFVELYREGLIYKDKRLVNWDPKLLTAISDLEVVQVETKGHLWHLRYPIEGKTFNPEDPSTFIVVATTRPETMLGDTAVAVHPDDERYKALVGKNVILPLVGRKIPIIADEYSDPEKGTGAVKITPAHDFNDFEVGKRHKLAQINVLTMQAKRKISATCSKPTRVPYFHRASVSERVAELLATWLRVAATVKLDGVDRFVARKQIVGVLEEQGLVEKIEPHAHRRAARRPLERGDRAVPHRTVVRQRARTCAAGDCRGARRQDQFHPEELGEHLFQLDGKHPALVHFAPAMVGPSNSMLVRSVSARRRHFCLPNRSARRRTQDCDYERG